MRRAPLLRAAIVALALLALEAVCRLGRVGPLTLIPPSAMVAALVEDARGADWFWDDVGYTLTNIVAAALLSIAGGFLAGLAVHALPRLRRVLDPLFSSYYSVPTFVFYPLLIAFFGIGPLPLIMIGAMFGIVAMIVATLTAIDRIPRALLKTARMMRLGPVRTAWLVKLPAAAPHLFTGAKLAVSYSVIGVIAGEFILATAGLGRRIAFAYNDFDSRTMYGVLLLILALVTVVYGLLHSWERRLHQRWYRR